MLSWYARPCLLQKSVKGTVETAGQQAQPTVPFAKNRQRHGRNRGVAGAIDRAFYKKSSKARSKPWGGGRNRPCLLQKNVKGTVEIAGQRSKPRPADTAIPLTPSSPIAIIPPPGRFSV